MLLTSLHSNDNLATTVACHSNERLLIRLGIAREKTFTVVSRTLDDSATFTLAVTVCSILTFISKVDYSFNAYLSLPPPITDWKGAPWVVVMKLKELSKEPWLGGVTFACLL